MFETMHCYLPLIKGVITRIAALYWGELIRAPGLSTQINASPRNPSFRAIYYDWLRSEA